jgi:hypothetical protein
MQIAPAHLDLQAVHTLGRVGIGVLQRGAVSGQKDGDLMAAAATPSSGAHGVRQPPVFMNGNSSLAACTMFIAAETGLCPVRFHPNFRSMKLHERLLQLLGPRLRALNRNEIGAKLGSRNPNSASSTPSSSNSSPAARLSA